jgi:hypothetical protein
MTLKKGGKGKQQKEQNEASKPLEEVKSQVGYSEVKKGSSSSINPQLLPASVSHVNQ